VNETHTTIFPHFAYPVHYHWRSVQYAAKFYGITERGVRQWCTRGRFASLSIPIYQDRSRRWWIAIPKEEAYEKTAG
jgi:hypothetical protein